MKKKNRKSSYRIGVGGIIIRAALVLFVLILLSIHLMGGLFAKYVSSASGSDSARVIKFHELTVTEEGDFVSKDGNNHTFIFAPGVTLKKSVKIAFGGSEAATYVFVKVTAPNWEPTDTTCMSFVDTHAGQLRWSVATGWKHLEIEGEYVYYMYLDPNKNLPATEFIKDAAVHVSPDGSVGTNTALEVYGNYPNISFTVTAYAIQANGVADAAAAWNALNH